MSARSLAILLLTSILACVLLACDDTNDPSDSSELSVDQDTAEGPLSHCSRIGFVGEEQLTYRDEQTYTYYVDGANGDELSIELYDSAITAAGSYELGGKLAESNYKTCTNCVLIASACDARGLCAKNFFATKGKLEVSTFASSGRFVGKLVDVELVEVRIDPVSFQSTPVFAGETWCIPELAFDSEVETLTCKSTADCSTNTRAKKCQTELGSCVQCLANGDCPTGELCAPLWYCAAKCKTDADCDEFFPRCDAASGACQQCVNNSHCAEPFPICDATNKFCVDCSSDTDCASNPVDKKCEPENQNCVQCLSDADCTAGTCDEFSNTCG